MGEGLEKTRDMSGLEDMIEGLRVSRLRTKHVIERLESGEYNSDFERILFDYELFGLVTDGVFDNDLGSKKEECKLECRKYIERVEKEKRRLGEVRRDIEGMNESERKFREKIEVLSNKVIFKELAERKYKYEGHVLYALNPEERRKSKRFEVSDEEESFG